MHISVVCCMQEQDFLFPHKPFSKRHTTTQSIHPTVSITNTAVYVCRYKHNFCFINQLHSYGVKVILFTVLYTHAQGTVIRVLNYCAMTMYGELKHKSTNSQASCSGCFNLTESETGALWETRLNFPAYHGLDVVALILRLV